MLQEILIWGAGYYGVLTALDLENKGIIVRGFIDNNARQIKTRLGLPVFEFDKDIFDKNFQILIAVLNENAIIEIAQKLSSTKFEFAISSLIPIQAIPKEYFEARKYQTIALVEMLKPLDTKNFKISIIIPVYNAEKYLRQCLDSIINQTYKNIEIICVNDASTDNSLTILNEYAQKDGRIIVINNRINEDASFARKTALDNSSGKYILPIDSDDWIEPNMIEILYYYTIFNGYDILCCGYFEERENNTIITLNPQLVSSNKVSKMKYGTFGFGNVKLLWNKLIKKEIYEKVIFNKTGTNEDCLITAQLFYYSNKIGYINTPLYHWRFNENSVTRSKKLAKKRYKDRKANYEHIIEFCKEKFGDDLSIFEPELSIRMAYIEKQNPEFKQEDNDE